MTERMVEGLAEGAGQVELVAAPSVPPPDVLLQRWRDGAIARLGDWMSEAVVVLVDEVRKHREREARGASDMMDAAAARAVVEASLQRRIKYRCNRCGTRRWSGELPDDPRALKVYPLPSRWLLISTPRGQDDHLRCWSCSKAVAQGEPEKLDGTCDVCGAVPGEPCDGGLHG